MLKQVKKILSQFALYRVARTRLKFIRMSRAYRECCATMSFPVPHQSKYISLRNISCPVPPAWEPRRFPYFLFNTSVATDPDNGDIILLHRVSNSVAPSYERIANLRNYHILQRGTSLEKALRSPSDQLVLSDAGFDPHRLEDIRLFHGAGGGLLGIGFLNMVNGGRPILVTFDRASQWRHARGRVLDDQVGVSTDNAFEKNWSVVEVSRDRLLLLTDAGAGTLFELPLDEGTLGIYRGAAARQFLDGSPRIPSQPIPFTFQSEHYLVAMGHYQFLTPNGERGYDTRMFFTRAAQPGKIFCVSAPIYFNIEPLGFIYAFQMIEIRSGTNHEIVISLNDSDRRTILVSLERKRFLAWCCEVLRANTHGLGNLHFSGAAGLRQCSDSFI